MMQCHNGNCLQDEEGCFMLHTRPKPPLTRPWDHSNKKQAGWGNKDKSKRFTSINGSTPRKGLVGTVRDRSRTPTKWREGIDYGGSKPQKQRLETMNPECSIGPHHTKTGFQQLGNSCYLNATLQCLLHTDLFTNTLEDCKTKTTMKENTIIEELSYINSLIGTGKFHSILPERLLNIINEKTSRFGKRQQEDAHELLIYMINSIKEEERGKMIVEEYFQGKETQVSRCTTCTVETKGEEIINCLPINLPEGNKNEHLDITSAMTKACTAQLKDKEEVDLRCRDRDKRMLCIKADELEEPKNDAKTCMGKRASRSCDDELLLVVNSNAVVMMNFFL